MNKFAIPLSSFAAGLVFAIGLGLAGMTQPQKIIAFLDVTGAWDPSLMFVMGGALLVHIISYRLIMKRNNPLFDSSFHIPKQTDVNKSLIGGSALFGIGWGLSGFCPGPAWVSVASLQTSAVFFLIAMLAGMFFADKAQSFSQKTVD